MPANFAPVCVRIDLESFSGPAHYLHRFRNGVGWLIMAHATEADGPREAFIAAACDEFGHSHRSFQVAHLLDCAWSLPEPCDGYAPEELEEMLGDEHGALALRWLRADYRELRQADEASEVALASQEKQTKARIDRIDRHLADLRRRRRSQGMTGHNLATIDATIIELSDLRDRETAAFARARRALRAETAEMEERFLLQSGLRVELEVTLIAHWRACVTRPVSPPRVLWQGGTHGRQEAGWLYAELGNPEAQARRHTAALSVAQKRSASRYQLYEPKNGGTAAACHFTDHQFAPKVAPVEIQLPILATPPVSTAPIEPAIFALAPSDTEATADGSADANITWGPDQVALLRRLWAADVPASAIALALGGLSRNAVISKAKRLKLHVKAAAVRQIEVSQVVLIDKQTTPAHTLNRLQTKLDGRKRVLAHVERLAGKSESEMAFWEKRRSGLMDEIETLAAQRAAMLAGQE